MATGRSPTDDYVKHEASFLTWLVFGWAGMGGLILFIFTQVIIPAGNRKMNRVMADLEALAKMAVIYEDGLGEFPNSRRQLQTFARDSSEFPVPSTFPENDPWKQGYLYFKISDERAAVVSIGKNGNMDTSIESLSAPQGHKVSEIDENIFRYCGEGDDWVYFAGDWKQEKNGK